MTPLEFIESITPKARQLYIIYGILQSLTISQACLESGFGKHSPGNNLFGFKWTSTCGYDFQLLWTKEFINGAYVSVQAKFRKYDSIDDSLDDYGKLIGTSKRYAPVLLCKDYTCATDQIRICGYATSPTYTTNLRNLIQKYKLYQLDNTMEDIQLTPNFKFSEFWSQGVTPPPDEYFNNVMSCATQLQIVRDIIGKPIIINSGYRTKAWNAANGGAINSFHLYGKAADTRAVGMSIKDYLHYILRYTNFNGIGINVAKNFIHSDLRKDFTIIHY